MGSEWPTVKFGEVLLNGARNGIYKKKELHGSGIKIVNMGELFAYPRLRSVPMKRVEVTAKELERASLQPGDLLFARRSLVAEGAGKCSIVLEVDEPTTFESSIIRCRPDPRKAHSLYLYYFFNSPQGRYLLGTIRRQVAVAGITGRDLVQLEIPLPPLAQQRAIAHILGTLDDKIELLRRMNETLEAMARALFKSWFVDFDPVIDNALEAGNPIPDELKEKAKRRLALGDKRKPLPEHIRRLFPNRFVDSELDPIPEGWRVGIVAELVSLSRESINPRDFPDEVFDHYSIPAFDAGKMPISEPGCAIKSNKLLVPRDAVLLSKLNPRFLRVWMPAVSWSRRSICSTEFLVALPKNGSSRDFIFCLFTEAGFLARFSSLVTGTSGSHQRVKPDSFLAMQIIIPPNDIVGSFTCLVRPSFEQLFRNLAQSRTLAALRDALLPKLISGEMRVKDAERILKEQGL